MKLHFTPRALENLKFISEYLRSKNPAGSRHVRAAIYESLQSLILFPRLGRLQKAEGVRKIVTRKYAYLIYYTIDADTEEIIVLNIKHPAQKREHSDT